MDRFQAMQLFTRIVELGSFSRAAEQLALPRASATQVIKQLEARLGVSLLHRTTRQVSPTLDGTRYYQHCMAILADVEAAESSFLQASLHPRGRLKVDLPASLGRLRVIPALPDFYRRYPDIRLDIGMGDRMIDLVREGVDCVVRIGGLSDSSLVARSLGGLEQVSCVSAGYADRYGLPTHPDQLDQHLGIDYLSATSGKLQPLEFTLDGAVISRTLPARLSVNHGEAYVAACEAGLGIVQIPRYHVARQLAAGTLVEILPAHRPPALPISVLYPHHRHLSPRLRVFIDWLVALFQK